MDKKESVRPTVEEFRVYNTKAASLALGKTPRTIRKWCKCGKLKCFKDITNNAWKVLADDVEDLFFDKLNSISFLDMEDTPKTNPFETPDYAITVFTDDFIAEFKKIKKDMELIALEVYESLK